MIRSAVALAGGALAFLAVAVAATYVAAAILLEPAPGPITPYPTGTFLLVSLGYSLGAGLTGGYVTGRLAPNHGSRHAAALAVLSLVPIISTGGAPAPGHPAWHLWVVTGLGAVGILAGSLLPRPQAAAVSFDSEST